MRTLVPGPRFLWILLTSCCFGLAAPAVAGAAWLLTPQLSAPTPRIGAHAWDADQQRMEAVWDLVHIYRHSLGQPGATEGLQRRLAETREDLRGLGARTVAEAGTDPQILALTILRHRALEEMCLRLALDHQGLLHAAAADSLSRQLRLVLEPLPANEHTAHALAAGIPTARVQWDRLHPGLYTLWRQLLFDPASQGHGNVEFLLFHALAPRDGRVYDDILARTSNNAAHSSLQELVQLNQQGRLGLFVPDDAARRLLLGLRQLTRQNRIHGGILPTSDRLAWMDIDPATPYPLALATLDSIQSVVDNARPAATWRGSAQSFHRPRDLPLEIAQESLRRLRHRFGARLLAQEGIHWSADLDPEELVPGQQVASWWRLSSTRLHHFHAWRGSLLDQVVSFRNAPAVIVPDTTVQVRSSFATLEGAAVGTSVLLQPTLRFALEGFGEVEISDDLAARVVAPIQASLDVMGGAVIGREPKHVAITVTSRSPSILRGHFEVVQSADWDVRPATAFSYELRRPGQTVRQSLEIQLPAYSSPGTYRLKVALSADAHDQGFLRTTLVKPLEWVVIGPFARPAPGTLLQPEQGVNFDRWYAGADGANVSWQLVSTAVYDVDGALDLDSMYENRMNERCACALTVVDSQGQEDIYLQAEGAERVQWNGVRVRLNEPFTAQSGRNTLLLRTCSQGNTWRLNLQLTDVHGDPIHTIDNDLSRLLDGFEAIRKAPAAPSKTAQRQVTVTFNAPGAREVAVLGAFNAWVPIELAKTSNGSWSRELLLKPGRYPYKLLVDGQLKPDPAAERFEPDGFGGRNSLLIVK